MAGRVIPVAEEIVARVYKPRGEVTLSTTRKMIDYAIESGKPIFDIGRDVQRAVSPWYNEEANRLAAKGYERVARGTVEVKKVTYQLYEWVKKK